MALLSLARPSWGIWLVLLLFLVHPLAARVATQNFGVSGTALLLASAWKEVAVVCAVASLGWARRRAGSWSLGRPTALDVAAALLVALVAIGLAMRHDSLAVNEARLLLFPVGVYVALRLSPVDATTYFRAVIAVGVGIALYGVVQSFLFGWAWVQLYWGNANYRPATFQALHLDGPRAAGTLASPSEFGFALMALALMATGLIVATPRRSRWIVPGLAMLLVGLAVSFSRSAIIATGLGIVPIVGFIVWRSKGDGRLIARLLAAAIIPAILISCVVYVNRGGVALLESTLVTIPGLAAEPAATAPAATEPTAAQPTATQPAATEPPGPTLEPGAVAPPPGNRDPSTLGHITSLNAGWAIVRDNPGGLGLGTVGARAVPGSDERPQYIFESWYLTMGAQLGWAGLAWCVLFLVALLLAAVGALRRGNALAGIVALAMTVSVAFASLLLPTMMEPQLAMLPWVVGALALAGSVAGQTSGASGDSKAGVAQPTRS